MNDLEFLKETKRLCKSTKGCCECVLSINNAYCGLDDLMKIDEEEFVSIVEKWSKEHPVKTRQSEFLKHYPNAKFVGDFLSVCPNDLDASFCGTYQGISNCSDCRRKYWSEEIKDE